MLVVRTIFWLAVVGLALVARPVEPVEAHAGVELASR